LFWPVVCTFCEMKTVAAISFYLMFHCAFDQQSAIDKIEFITGTRGYKRQVFISNDSVIAVLDGRAGSKVQKRKIAQEEWTDLMDALEDVSVSDLPNLQSPTSRRAFDGAKQSTITLYSSQGQSWSHTFDDENPNPELIPLMKCISKIAPDQ
jgi:hypothetical protein